jgi:quercetin 2,3-dioxygenase
MKFMLRPSQERGLTDHGWLVSRHTFSFADYRDFRHTGFHSLFVINEDRITGMTGFPMHPHQNMEIFSYVLSGSLEHRDSLGNGRVLNRGEVQLMSAGRGIRHCEFNPSKTEGTHFLQVWILPSKQKLEPRYTEWKPPANASERSKLLVISEDGREGSAVICQDAEVYRLHFKQDTEESHALRSRRGLWVQVMSGSMLVLGQKLEAGDGLAIEATETETEMVSLLGQSDGTEALLFDLV